MLPIKLLMQPGCKRPINVGCASQGGKKKVTFDPEDVLLLRRCFVDVFSKNIAKNMQKPSKTQMKCDRTRALQLKVTFKTNLFAFFVLVFRHTEVDYKIHNMADKFIFFTFGHF